MAFIKKAPEQKQYLTPHQEGLNSYIEKAIESKEYLNASFADRVETANMEQKEILDKAFYSYLEDSLIKTINEAKDSGLSFKDDAKKSNDHIFNSIKRYGSSLLRELGGGGNSYRNDGEKAERIKAYVDTLYSSNNYVLDGKGFEHHITYLRAPENKELLKEFQKDEKALLGALKNEINLLPSELKKEIGDNDPIQYLESKLNKEKLDKELSHKPQEPVKKRALKI